MKNDIEDGKTGLNTIEINMHIEREHRNRSEKIGKSLGQTVRLALKLEVSDCEKKKTCRWSTC